MVNRGYNVGGQYIYFKAGILQGKYSGNDDYKQATYYALTKLHTTN